MKHDVLRSIAHNIADSLASGIGPLIGYYVTNVFEEAGNSSEGYITVDFLNGTTSGGMSSEILIEAVACYSEILPVLCEKHGVDHSFFQFLTVRYFNTLIDKHVIITIEDKNGRRSSDEYVGIPLSHVKALDRLGRIRTKRKKALRRD